MGSRRNAHTFLRVYVPKNIILDLGYAAGVYQWASKDAAGKDYHETGKFCETWKKQPAGNWKCIVDIWNADPLVK